MKHVALLRGINVGGKNKLPMAELSKICAGAGCKDVLTYIQSGNVVFSAPASATQSLAARIQAGIEKKFGYNVPVVIRSHAQLASVVTANPFLKSAPSEKWLHVAFLAETPTASAIASLDPNRSPGDSFAVIGKDVFLCVAHAAKTKLTNAWLDSKLSTVSTARNWNTVLTLVEMTR